MRYAVQFTSKFKKNYKKMQKRGLKIEKLEEIVDKLRNGEKLALKHKDHILKGEFNGYHECHIEPDWLLIYKIQNDVLILTLVDTGSHSDLFNK
ncbi:type II toxin-antitoxin system YafQ family toxin [Candidatus Saccharibacteria bacterium]|nr:type II toxin-antitoxin system YafQ family toxin [Candidatus Saccharibacteria bacterium]